MGTRTPWGEAQGASTKIGVGIRGYSTAGHGGIHLSKKRNNLVPEYMRNATGWYEEDCEWAIPAVVFPNEFKEYHGAEIETKALDTLRNWFPSHYEMYVCKKLTEGESYIRDQEIFKERNKDNYVVISATLHESGRVLAIASIGGKRGADVPTKNFLVNCSEYGERGTHGFVIDLTKHEEEYLPKQ